MQLGRRELFKMLGLASAGVGISALAPLTPEVSAQSSARTVAERIKITPSNWPFNEIRIPFRERKEKVKWPNNARLAILTFVTAEWFADIRNRAGSLFQPDISYMSGDSRYPFTVGIYRALDLIEKYRIKVSCFPTGDVVAAYPDVIKEFHQLGHEITAHSMHENQPPAMLSPLGEEAIARQVTDAIAQLTGERPVGWRSPEGRCTPRTPEILASLGYLWFGDLSGDDIPYGMRFGSNIIVTVPWRPESTMDAAIFNKGEDNIPGSPRWPLRGPSTAFEYFRKTFDAYYQTAITEAPTIMMYGITPYWGCWPDRVVFHDKALKYMKGFKDVWFARHRDVAQWWRENYLQMKTRG